jgi:hypothetical protein
VINALLGFGQQEHIGMGLDDIDAVAVKPRATTQVRAATVATFRMPSGTNSNIAGLLMVGQS